MSYTAVVPPVPTTATNYATRMAFYVGGPRSAVRDATLANGIPTEIAASTTLALPWSQDSAAAMHLTDASDFTSVGAVRLTDPATLNDYWYVFESRVDNDLYGLTPVFQSLSPWVGVQGDVGFPAGTAVSQWYDISSLVTRWKRENHSGNGESWWTMDLEGVGWNSLQLYQGASVLAVSTHYDDILGWHNPNIWFQGQLQLPQVSGDPRRNRWQCSAEGIRADLKLQRDTPGEWGGEVLAGQWTGSEALADTSAEPLEGDNPSDFGIPNITDDDRTTLYISKDTPGATDLRAEPHGAEEDDFRLLPKRRLPNSGRGLRIQMAYINPVNSPKWSAQRQKFIVIQNTQDLEPPTQDDTPSAAPGVWGVEDLTQYHLELLNRSGSPCGNSVRPTVIYLGSKNGGPAPGVKLLPGQGAVLCYDETVFRAAWTVPAGWPVIEVRQCGGDKFGEDLALNHRGVGLQWDPDPAGCTIALRSGGYAGNDQDDGRYSAEVLTDAGGDEIFLTNVTAPGLTSWPNSGYIRSENGNKLAYYTGIDYGALKLFGVGRPVAGDRASPMAVADRVNVRHNAGFWFDYVAIGSQSLGLIPNDFPVKRAPKDGTDGGDVNDDGEFHDQNDGSKGEHVWGIWDNSAAEPIVWDDGGGGNPTFLKPEGWSGEPDGHKYAPACPVNQAVRRRGTLGGGIFQQFASEGDSSWHHHDSNSWADWEVQASPRMGVIDELNAFVYLKFDAAEHTAAEVVVDDTDVNDATGILTVKENQAREYPGASIPGQMYLRALMDGGGFVDFTYDGRTASEFLNVVKINGTAGVEIDAGATLTKVINTRAGWNHSGADAWIQRNMPIGLGLSIERWMGLRDAEVLSLDSGVIYVRPGQANGFPVSGTLTIWPPVEQYGGITVIPTNLNPDQRKATYTGRTDSAFTGVTYLGDPPQIGWQVSVSALNTVSFPTDFDILGSREDTPVDPTIFIDQNESWDILYKSTGNQGGVEQATSAGMVTKFFPFGGPGQNPFYQHYFIKFHRMSDLGRLKANRVIIHKQPTRTIVPAGDQTAQHDWNRQFLTSTLAQAVFLEAGVPAAQMRFSGGATVLRWPIAEGNVWDVGRGMAAAGGDLLTNTSDNQLLFRPDPQASGAPFTSAPKLVLDTVSQGIWGDVTATARPNRAVAQIQLEARDPARDRHFTIFSPSDANPYGEIRVVPGMLVASEEAADKMARLLWRRANGGWRLQVPGGPFFDGLEYGDIISVRDTIDAAGRMFATEFMVVGVHDEGEQDRMRSSIDLLEWVVP